MWPGAFDRRVFERVGLFDPKAITNEDAELNQRILESGGRVYMSRDIVSHYYPRESMRALARQYFRYGQGRARTLLKHRKLPSIRPALPFLGLVGEAFVLVRRPGTSAALSLAAYALATGAEAVRVGAGRRARGDPGGVGHLPGAPRVARRGLRGRAREVPCCGRTGAPPSTCSSSPRGTEALGASQVRGRRTIAGPARPRGRPGRRTRRT